MKILFERDAWVVLWFDDETAQTVHTTFNNSILDRYGVAPVSGQFFDLDRLKFIPFREDAVNIEVFTEKPMFNSEVNQFGSRFI